MTTLGQYSLSVAAAAALAGVLLSFFAHRKNSSSLSESAQRIIFSILALLTLCVVSLEFAFVRHDYSVSYVYGHSSNDMPLFYIVTALWGGMEGSMLFWAWLLSIFSTVAILQYKKKLALLMPAFTGMLSVLFLFFTTLMLFTANPFALLRMEDGSIAAPDNGQGLNPLLQNPGMVFHPPSLYTGFVGLSIPFALAMAALLTGQLGEQWVRASRRWTLFAWYFLSLGIMLGGAWSYVELGWGGYWAWDPVENSSFMPWLTATAFLHSIMVQEKRRMLKSWNMTLIIMAFTLSLLGTFFTRSGVLSSIHSFTQSPSGPYFLSFIGVLFLFSFSLLIARSKQLKSENEMDSMVCRESAILFNNLALLSACFAVFLGTIFPVISEVVTGKNVSVGMPYFNAVFSPLALFMLFLMGIGPVLPWRKATSDQLKRNFLVPFLFFVLVPLLLFAAGMKKPVVLFAYGLLSFVLVNMVSEFVRGTHARHKISGKDFVTSFLMLVRKNKRRYGGFVVHIGVVLISCGIIGSFAFTKKTEATLKQGEKLKIGRYELGFEGLGTQQEMNAFAVSAFFTVYNSGTKIARIHPQKRFYPTQKDPMTEVAIRSTLRDDLYVALSDFNPHGKKQTATVRVLLNPLVSWIWIGALLLTVGAVISGLHTERVQADNV